MGIGVEIAIIVALVVANGVFAMSEIAVVSARKARLQQLADEGDHRARHALALAEHPGRFLSTVQVGITLIGTLSGAFGGARLSGRLAPVLEPLPLIGGSAEAVAFILVVVAITYLSLIIGELVPKRLGLSNPERVAATMAGPMSTLSRATAPVIWLLETSTQLVLRLLPVRRVEEPPVTESEIAVLLEQGTEAGVFVEAERAMIERVFDLGDQRAVGLMTPRPDVTWLDLEEPFAANREVIVASLRSIFPVGDGSLDEVRGVVRAKDVLAYPPGEGPADLMAFIRPAVFVPESMPALRLLETFRLGQDPLAVVVDEYGGTQGVVTLHDVLEAIVGDLGEEGAPEDLEAVRRPDGSWLLDGMLPVERFLDVLDVRAIPADETGDYNTVSGFVMARLGKIPAATDTFDWHDWRFEVVDMDGNRIDKVLASPETPHDPDLNPAESD